ncbi:MAG: 1-acyl-sn-glycerol-3-phosphate acyltransferase [Phycisphaeraceae bacterium]|nr:1-acyl-sn-glycerol-3-phosphate acyltransferase [Phycisphaeraceae bacterium]
MPLRSLDPTQPLSQILFYRFCYWLVMLPVTLLYRFRIFGAGNLPRRGGLLVVCNHQSHWDPPILGISFRTRNMASIGREGLFRVPVLSQIIRGLGCIPIKEDEGDAGAIRAAIAELKRGRVMLIFPEGTRTPDGEIKEFKRGAWVLLSRAKVDVLPAAIEGAFDSWPRSNHLPSLFGHRIAVSLGKPIPFDELKALGPERGLARLREEVQRLHTELAEKMGR